MILKLIIVVTWSMNRALVEIKKFQGLIHSVFINPVFNWRQREKKSFRCLKKKTGTESTNKKSTIKLVLMKPICNVCDCEKNVDINRSSNVSWVNKLFLFIYFWLSNLWIGWSSSQNQTEWFVYESESWIWLNSKRLQQLKACWKENVQWKLTNISTCSSQKNV